jgi:Ti-type conjugative transfer relaxase TraA
VAAYHLSAKVVSRSKGGSAVRSAAYRAGEKIYDERTGQQADYSRKSDVVASVILAPSGTPKWAFDRATLWNRVEECEKRKDSQLAAEFELNLPQEFSDAENWRLLTDFVKKALVSKGRVCDVAYHKPNTKDGDPHPHAHILMPMRSVSGDGFGKKHADMGYEGFFGRSSALKNLREQWCEFARGRAAELGIDLGPDWDHRSFATRGIDLIPQGKRGAAAERIAAQGLESDRIADYAALMRANGEKLLASPEIALKAITDRQSTFTAAELARYIDAHCMPDQFNAILEKAKARCVLVGKDKFDRERFSTPDMVAVEKGMLALSDALTKGDLHKVKSSVIQGFLDQSKLSAEQKLAAELILRGSDFSTLVGYAGSGKSTMFSVIRSAYEAAGFQVRGAALSGIAAENFEAGSGIASRTLASWRHAWGKGFERLTSKDVLVIDEAGMIGSRELAATLRAAKDAGAKVILVGDPEQLQAIEAGAAFRALTDRHGAARLAQVRRQAEAWMRDASYELATGKTAEAIVRYRDKGSIRAFTTEVEARDLLLKEYLADHAAKPERSQMILTHTRALARELNDEIRAQLQARGRLAFETRVETSRGPRDFARGDRIMFLKNDRELAVKNGLLGEVVNIQDDRMTVVLDKGKTLSFKVSDYPDIDHGYASTVHKAQGVTVDQAYVLASRGFDRQLAYVAMTRHREKLSLHYSRETFGRPDDFDRIMSRDRSKDTTLDYEATMLDARDIDSTDVQSTGAQIAAMPPPRARREHRRAVERYREIEREID